MTVFIDTSLFLASRNCEDQHYHRAEELMENALRGTVGRLYTSDYIIDECITTALARTGRHDLAVNIGKYIIDSPRFLKLIVDPDIFKLAWTKFQALKDKDLSFTDCTSLALIEKHEIKQIMSFDQGFDGLIQRIC